MNIIDFQQLHREFPETFPLPSKEAMHNIIPGDLVKICVEPERFWVRVETINGNEITGNIFSDLIHTGAHKLKAQDRIQFEKKHIYRINK